MYIQKLEPVKLFDFLKKEYAGCKLEPARFEPATNNKNNTIVKFKMVRNKIARMYIAEFSDYKCVVADIISDPPEIDKVFTKKWAEYVVDVFNEKQDTKSIAEQYKKDYNAHLIAVKEEKHKAIDQECEQNLLK